MALRHVTPLTLRPAGISDALDGSTVFAGAMALLANLIPDPSTKNLWQCRPAAVRIIDFLTSGGPFSSGFSSGFQIGFSQNSGFISALQVDGSRAYGMVATDRNLGRDEPFIYDLVTNSFVLLGGTIDSVTTPLSPPTTGAWTPPTMSLVGTKLMVTHPGFTGVGGSFIGWFDLTNPAAPTWNAGNIGPGIVFTVAPTAVQQFGNRAYYAHNPSSGQPSLIFSDVLNATVVTNANQALTFGDTVPLNALGALPFKNITGGIVQSLVVFKANPASAASTMQMFSVTGDSAANNLAQNAFSVPTGTLAPNTVVSVPQGLMFIAPDGLRIIDASGQISDPIGYDGAGKALPFLFSVVPSRMCAACNGNVLRISVQDGSLVNSPNKEYWLDLVRKNWSGPHSFPASLIAPYGNTFIMSPIGVLASLWQSDVIQSSTSSFTENSVPLTWDWVTCMLPDTDQMAEYAMVESTIHMQLVGGLSPFTFFALDQNGNILDTVSVTTTGGATVWGGFTWGAAVWGGAQNALFPRRLPWTKPIEFRRLQIRGTGQSALGVRISTLHMRYQKLGYLQVDAA